VPNIAVLGAQWGDEGKGKIVDLLTPNFSIDLRGLVSASLGKNASRSASAKKKKRKA